jgi:hypothetical protein
MPIEVLDPTYGGETRKFALAGRPVSLEGATVGVISNGKQNTRPFFDALERELLEHLGVAEVVRATKSNYSAPADPEIMDRARQWTALVAGVGD